MSAQPQELWQLAPMERSHLPLVMDVERRAYAFPWTEGIFNDCLKVNYSAWVVQNPLGELLAYAVMSMAAGEAHVLNLCVAPEFQGQGLARFLLRHLLDTARSRHMTEMLLEVRKSNRAALGLYESFGFGKLGMRKGYYPAHGGREDAWVLGLQIT